MALEARGELRLGNFIGEISVLQEYYGIREI
jgi:hypothetical protein